MKLSMAIHKAADYFFCDRCPTEVITGRISEIVGEKLCPLNWLWKLLPEEPFDEDHPIRFPRSWLGTVLPDQGKQQEGEIR